MTDLELRIRPLKEIEIIKGSLLYYLDNNDDLTMFQEMTAIEVYKKCQTIIKQAQVKKSARPRSKPD